MEQEKNHYKTSWYGKPYYFFGDYLHDKYSCRVQKLPINAGLSCPNRDGTLAYNGCIFCSDEGSASPTCSIGNDITAQMKNAVTSLRRHDAGTRYIAYFQAFTNTAAPVSRLRELYDTALTFPDVIGLMIGTRPDCFSDETARMISGYSRDNFELWLELGMQTSHDRSLDFLERHHTTMDTVRAVQLADKYSIPVCLHVILGIPGETWNDMMETAEMISNLPVRGIKIHHLHVIKGTRLETIYREKKFHVFSMNEYVSMLCDFLERIRPDILVHRINADREESTLVTPLWGLHKGSVQKAVDDEFTRRGTWQGFLGYWRI